MEDAIKVGFNTICIHGDTTLEKSIDNTGSISFPIYQTATFAHPGVGKSTGYDYSRAVNPTRQKVEQVVTELEQGVQGFGFSTGMAAMTAVMDLFEAGSHIIASDDLYGGSVRYFNTISAKNGVAVSYVDAIHLEEIQENITPGTKAIFIETPGNPLMKILDIEEIAKIAHKNNVLLIVDNTFLSPYLQKPLTLGADIVIHSATKFLGGHNDTLAGFVIVNSEEIAAKIKFNQMTTGAVLAPFDSWLILRGIKTLPIRIDRAQENAARIVEFLQSRSEVKKIYYAGLKDHPGYEINKKQSRGSGSMVSFELESKEAVISLLENVRVFNYAESLGGVESLITYPMLQTHADVPVQIREKLGINERLVRVSVGIENVEDLINDLTGSLEVYHGKI